ncbi:diguanylate cyclase domain-containing protein [Varunaivibrio sulfuroxidans]|uniref:PAS domain S-box-containing protein/diguanylate cyclase (GGDEF)-like protein n=1 Tax=Varunaivibrio sulfuroxidans TaxID=1773489 RepID=A0A4V6NYK9_9PROT|nr:diguanylate cyclase [Varunaivibrio sulfuroxidans]TCS65011.1 PAS domain S-box-containing protein/diguanylate cyclase (GGDEF)-like protein [Varunaivibrio sulfuroxidans]WES29698.1 diguanylate cyclase [Varunaivibrio sulfuroxidans]
MTREEITHDTPATDTRPPPSHDAARTLIDTYGEAAALLDETGGVVFTNAKARKLSFLFDGPDGAELRGLAQRARALGRVSTLTLSLPTAGAHHTFDAIVVPSILNDLVLILLHDQSLDHNLRSALVESRQRYKDLVEVSSDFSWEVDEQELFSFVSPTGALGYPPHDIVGEKPETFVISPQEYAPLPFISKTPETEVEVWMRSADGEAACVLVSALPILSEDGRLKGVRGIGRDVSIERARTAALARATHREQVLGYIVRSIRDEVNPNAMLAAAATATARALGAQGCRILRVSRPDDEDQEGPPPEQTQQDPYQIAATYGDDGLPEQSAENPTFTPEDLAVRESRRGEWRILEAPCQYRHAINGVLCLFKREQWVPDDILLAGEIAGHVGIAIEQVIHHERIVTLSRTDSLTGLLNRRAFYDEELPRRAARLKQDNLCAALFYVDMDNFKLVNDEHGHHKGDEAILALCTILREFSRPGDMIARLGGDEFALWLDGMDETTAQDRARQLIEKAQALREFSGVPERPLGISVGIAVYRPQSGENLSGLLARADRAMYQVKHQDKGRFLLAPPYDGGGAPPPVDEE